MSQPENVQIDAIGIVSQGRLTFSLTDHLVYMHAAKLGIPIAQSWGAIWEKQLSRRMEDIVEKSEVKYLLFFDGDGAWTKQDILELYRIIEHETIEGKPIDAVFPVQADRMSNLPLAYNFLARDVYGLDHFDYGPPTTKVLHGHFGLTFIRTSFLRDHMPKPWLQGLPGDGGSWRQGTPGQMDPDTFFWVKAADCGANVVQANHVVIGHLELMVRWQNGARVANQTINDFVSHGKPRGLRCPVREEFGPEESPNIGPQMEDDWQRTRDENEPVAVAER